MTSLTACSNHLSSTDKVLVFQPPQFNGQGIGLPTTSVQWTRYWSSNHLSSTDKVLVFQPPQFNGPRYWSSNHLSSMDNHLSSMDKVLVFQPPQFNGPRYWSSPGSHYVQAHHVYIPGHLELRARIVMFTGSNL